MLKKIYQELILIYEELQAIRSSLELGKFVPEDSDGKHLIQNSVSEQGIN